MYIDSDLSFYIIVFGGAAVFELVLIWSLIYRHKTRKNNEKTVRIQDEYMKKRRITKTQDFKYFGPESMCRFVVDDEKKAIYVSSIYSNNKLIKIPYNELVYVYPSIKMVNEGSYSGAIIGGILGGRYGSYKGATTGTIYVTSYRLIITRRNVKEPEFILPMLEDSKMQKDNPFFIDAERFDHDVCAVSRAIKHMR